MLYSCVWVIGANSDLAKQIVKALCERSLAQKFYLGSRDTNSLNEFIAPIANKASFSVVHLDLVHSDSISDFIDHGDIPDLVLMAAGYLYKKSPISEDELKKVVIANYSGKVFFLERAQSKIRSSGKCKVVCINSTAGELGDGNNRFYGSSKAAMKVYMQGFSFANFKFGTQTYIVRPGDMSTKMKPIGGHFTISPEAAAKIIIKKIGRTSYPNGSIVYIPWFIKYLLSLTKIKRAIYDFRHSVCSVIRSL